MSKENIYSIHEISEMFDLPTSTLRYYEDVGILTKVERTGKNQRVYCGTYRNGKAAMGGL